MRDELGAYQYRIQMCLCVHTYSYLCMCRHGLVKYTYIMSHVNNSSKALLTK